MPASDDIAVETADLTLIREAAAEAGRIAMRYFRRSPEVWMKAGSSPVSEADFAVDRFLRETLLAARPDYGWLSEETADTPDRLNATRTFVVDPIDGTRAYIDGRNTWCVSVAVVEAGRPIAGVLDCPAREEVFLATVGAGSTLNGTALRVSVGEPLILGGPAPLLDRARSRLSRSFTTHPYVPSLAYRIAMVATGRLHGSFVKSNAQDWDLAAADLVLQEAGGSVLDASGKRPGYAGKLVAHAPLAAASGELLEGMVSVLREDAGMAA